MPRPKRQFDCPPPGFTNEERNPNRRRRGTEAPAPAASPAASAGGGDLFRAFGRCRALLDKLLRHEDGWVFSEPVDARALGLRDYYTVIQEPMDLGTVLLRLERRRYADPHAFAADVRLTFSNAKSYNAKGDPVYESADELSEIFEAGWAQLAATLAPPPPTDAQRREKLKNELPRLPADVQRSVAAFLKVQAACLVKEELNVDVDLDKADAMTLGMLDRMVAQYLPPGQ
ncbi:hypothetical protein PR202_gb05362 [Eleusine coracana subsp. coracana]|uniref:Bromo domain-containing protein n=1 Tax=Eleusine coracana subsp. coracana TaxID=191504 RepID=A0AAV5E710_ELECO|nr:hypothetical protein PR202_gb05362 [Eleusine coracana subsp. coracana]